MADQGLGLGLVDGPERRGEEAQNLARGVGSRLGYTEAVTRQGHCSRVPGSGSGRWSFHEVGKRNILPTSIGPGVPLSTHPATSSN